MKNFKKIGELVTSSKVKLKMDNELTGSENETKMEKLLSGIISGAYANDEEAAWDIYRCKPTDKNYLMLKSRIKDQLVSHIFEVDAAKKFTSLYDKASYQCLKQITAARVLLILGLRKEAVELLKVALKKCRQFHFTELVVLAARMLRNNAGFAGTTKEVWYYEQILNKHFEILGAELESDNLRDLTNAQFRTSFSVKSTTGLKSYWDKAKELADNYDTHTLRLNKYRIGIRYFESSNDFMEIVHLCDECEQYLDSKSQFQQAFRYAEFALYKMDACLSLGDYERGKENAETCLKYYSRGGINWLVFHECYFLLCIHTKNYDQAAHIYQTVRSHSNYNSYSADRKEKWKLFNAYLNIVHRQEDSDFKLFKFLNEVPVYSKDKRGYNLSIIIAQIILLLDGADFEKLLDKYESFKTYFNRYVNRHVNYRSFYFCSMVMVMYKYNFDFEKTKEIAQKFYDRLTEKTPYYDGSLESLEIIPYEQLWQMVLDKLEKHRHAFAKKMEG